MARKAGAHEVSPEIQGSIDVPTIEAISGLKNWGGVYTSCGHDVNWDFHCVTFVISVRVLEHIICPVAPQESGQIAC